MASRQPYINPVNGTKLCTGPCNEVKPVQKFGKVVRSDGSIYFKPTCNECRYLQEAITGSKAKRRQAVVKFERANNINHAKYVFQDCRHSDKQNGRENDLTLEFVQQQVSQPCAYCLSTDIPMGLDRQDNLIGHVMSNCLPCCQRCNYMRKNIPIDIWMKLTPIIKQLADKGAFGVWEGTVHEKQKLGMTCFYLVLEEVVKYIGWPLQRRDNQSPRTLPLQERFGY